MAPSMTTHDEIDIQGIVNVVDEDNWNNDLEQNNVEQLNNNLEQHNNDQEQRNINLEQRSNNLEESNNNLELRSNNMRQKDETMVEGIAGKLMRSSKLTSPTHTYLFFKFLFIAVVRVNDE